VISETFASIVKELDVALEKERTSIKIMCAFTVFVPRVYRKLPLHCIVF